MKLNLTTLILLGIALLFGTGVYWFERQAAQEHAAEESSAHEHDGTPIFNFTEDQVQTLTVKRPKQTLVFERTKNSFPQTWKMRTPKQTPANEAAVAYLLNLLATGRSTRTLNVPAAQKQEFGLDQPLATIDVQLKNQQRHQLVLGKLNFNQSAIYAQADPAAQPTLQVLLAPTTLETAVNRPLAEWQQPPKGQPSQPLPIDVD